MKVFLLSLICFAAAVSAAPDEFLKLGEDISNAVEIAKEAPQAPPEENDRHPLTTSIQGTAEDRTRLLEHLMKDYNKKVNPDNVSLQFGVALLSFEAGVRDNTLDSYAWLRMTWDDSRLKWAPEDFGGAKLLRLTPDDVWLPDVTLYNSADPVNMVNCWHSNVLIFSSGKVLWVPPCKMISHCVFNKKEPYGETVCPLKFGSWTFDGNILDLQFYKKNSTIDLGELHNTGGYEVVSADGERHEKFYSCCVEPYPDITYNLTIKRIPGEELFKRL